MCPACSGNSPVLYCLNFNRKDQSTSDSDTESSTNSLSSEESTADDVSAKKSTSIENEKNTMKMQTNLDLLLDLYSTNENNLSGPVMTLTPLANSNVVTTNSNIQVVNPCFVPNKSLELLNRITGKGLQITYKYTRTPHLFSNSMVNIALTFLNNSNEDVNDIKIGQKVSFEEKNQFSVFTAILLSEPVAWHEHKRICVHKSLGHEQQLARLAWGGL